MADTLTPDQQAILSALKDGPLDMIRVGRVILGEPPRDGRTRAHKAWTARTLELWWAWLDLAERDILRMVDPVAPGEPWRSEIVQ